jgi:hypothetical protein
MSWLKIKSQRNQREAAYIEYIEKRGLFGGAFLGKVEQISQHL